MHIYDGQIASHYAAYRPPLHRLIVDDVLNDQHFETGLDIGCGTGYSAVALAEKCKHVFAVGHSQAMLDRATKHSQISYLLGSGNELPIGDASIDIVTFSGILSYLKPDKVAVELKRVCRSNALVLVYDFEVILEDLMQIFSLSETTGDGPYDHAYNLAGHEKISTLNVTSRSVEIAVPEQQAAHILLSDKSRYDPLAVQFDSHDPLGLVVDTLKQEQWAGMLNAKVYYSLHRLEN